MFIACRHHTNYFILKIKFYDYFSEQMKKKEINRTRKSANGIFFIHSHLKPKPMHESSLQYIERERETEQFDC